MNKIAVIGLGIMGHGIADNFQKKGYSVVVWNRNPRKADDLVAKGAILAGSPAEAAEAADVVFEVTANDESSRAVWLGADGILSRPFSSPKFLITCATLSAAWVDELAEKASVPNVTFIDMPMTGGRIGAETGSLTLLVGGDSDKLEQIKPDLKAIASGARYFGAVGAGTKYKLILNTLQAIHIAGLGEALRMARKAGLDEKLVGDALAERPGGVITNLAWRDYQVAPEPINFSVEWIAKDLGYAAGMAEGVVHPLLDDVRKQYSAAIEQGFDQEDWTKINKL